MAEIRRRRSDRQAVSESAAAPLSPMLSSEAENDELTSDAIGRRAYELYQHRGGGHGQDWDDWFRAEQEVRGRGE